MPAAAKVKSKAGLEAFARHWMKVEAYLQETGDASPYLAMARPACGLCADVAKAYREVYAAGGRYEGDLELQVRQVNLVSIQGDSGVVELRGHFPESRRIAKPGAKPEIQKSALVDYAVNTQYMAGGWKVTETAVTAIKEGL